MVGQSMAGILGGGALSRFRVIFGPIRLHQVKYAARTGVPPVERGMLMFYNMGQLEPASARGGIP